MARTTKADLELENNELKRRTNADRTVLNCLIGGEMPDADEIAEVNTTSKIRLRLFRCEAPHGGVVLEEWLLPNGNVWGFSVNFLDDRKEDGAGYEAVNEVIKKFKDVQIARNLKQAV